MRINNFINLIIYYYRIIFADISLTFTNIVDVVRNTIFSKEGLYLLKNRFSFERSNRFKSNLHIKVGFQAFPIFIHFYIVSSHKLAFLFIRGEILDNEYASSKATRKFSKNKI